MPNSAFCTKDKLPKNAYKRYTVFMEKQMIDSKSKKSAKTQ